MADQPGEIMQALLDRIHNLENFAGLVAVHCANQMPEKEREVMVRIINDWGEHTQDVNSTEGFRDAGTTE